MQATSPPPEAAALELIGLRTEFRIGGAWHPAVRDISLRLARDETLALVGESGCGKSVTALSVMGLVAQPHGKVVAGKILVDGQDLATMTEKQREKLRGDRIAMVFQEPMTSLNPVMTVGDQVAESLRIHKGLSRKDALEKARQLFEEVKIPSPAKRLGEYPHQFSGGMRQRVMIAMALACEPAVLLADEPTTALDVTIQAQVLGLLNDLRQRRGMAVLFITHNLGVVAQIADRVAVMYAGDIVEEAPVESIFAAPAHPYTKALFAAIPRLDQPEASLQAIPGRVPPLDKMPAGCRFAARCPSRQEGCEQPQALVEIAPRHRVRCHVASGVLTEPWPMLDPKGRVAMVSGASRGIGKAVADALLAEGYAVSIGVRDPARIEPRPNLSIHRYDAAELAAAAAWVEATMALHKRIDVLVNAAGINNMARLSDGDETALDRLWAINVKAPMRLIRTAWSALAAGGEGRVMNLASLSGKRVKNENVGYAMSKSALISLTHAVRREGWELGIRASAICPGFVETDMTSYVTKMPRNQMSRPEDLAAMVVALIRLPNTATVAELLLNCRHEDML